jgi:putative PIN family toxin of toxin-antitoxin system
VKEIPRVVFDTNILFSAVGWCGSPYHCIQAARHGNCHSLTCESILTELGEKLQLKRSFTSGRAAETLDEIRLFSKVIPILGNLKVIAADADDDSVVECALLGHANYLVSGDRHLLALGSYQDIQIVKAAEFLALF